VIGFLGGGLVAIYLLPLLWDKATGDAQPGSVAAITAVAIVIVCASVGQAFTTHLGNKMRRGIRWSPARVVDAAGGAVVNVAAMLLVAWLIGSALATTTLPTVAREARTSHVLTGVARVLPTQANTWFADFQAALAQDGVPQVFTPYASEPVTDVPAPDPKLAHSAVVTRARRGIVKVIGTAPGCGKQIEGSGFVFAHDRVMTNAHVVGGVSEPTVQIGGEGRLHDARVVLYDWKRDIAVLDVPGLKAPALHFATRTAATGDGAIVAGFPENGGFDVRSARVRDRITAVGLDIYRRGIVHRDVYSLYTTVRPGNSGGPMLAPDGTVYGVVFAKYVGHAHTGYALTAQEVAADVAAGRTATAQVGTEGCAL
jgi:S1-C subfamily serine protease